MGRRLRLLLALAVVVAALGGATAYAVVRHAHALPTVTCRDLLESAQIHRLPAVAVRDLQDPAFDVDVERLRLPLAAEVDVARRAMQPKHVGPDLGPALRDALVCGTGVRGELLLVQRDNIRLEPCLASAAQCSGEPTERRTCAERWTFAGTVVRSARELGCPDLH